MQDYEIIKQAFTNQSALVLEGLNRLEPAQWDAPTRLEGWTVYTLVAHMLRVPQVVVTYASQAVSTAPVVDRLSYWNFNGQEIAAGVTERALQSGASTTRADMAQTFAATRQAALDTLERIALTTVISSAYGAIRFGEYLVTRILELVVHSLDLNAALPSIVKLDQQAVALTVASLEGLLNQPRSAEMTDDIQFIEAAAGRIKHPSMVIPAFT